MIAANKHKSNQKEIDSGGDSHHKKRSQCLVHTYPQEELQ